MVPRRILTVVLLFLTLALFWKINLPAFLLGREVMWDFDVYYQTALDVRRGADPYQVPYMQTAGPPAVIIPYLPLTLVSLPVARSMMIVASLVSALASCWLIARHVFRSHYWQWTLVLHFLLWLTFLPRYNLNVGQPNLIIMLLVTLLLTTQNRNLKGVSAALITLLKTHYLVSWLTLIKNHLKVLLVAVATLVGLIVLSGPVIKPQHYFNYVTQRASGYVTTAPPLVDLDYYNQSLRSTLSRLSLNQFYPLIIVSLGVVGSLQLFRSGDVASGVLVSLLVSPIVWQHYLVVVYPIGILTMYEYTRRGRIPWYVTLASGLLILHMPWLHGQPVTFTAGLFASHFYFGVLLLWVSRCIMTVRGRIA